PIVLPAGVDVSALERALERLGDRHECLRARFVTADGGGAQQVFDPFLALDLAVTDLGSVAPSARRAEADRVQATEARGNCDLSTGPLIRARLVRLGAREQVLFVTVHHIVADARSVEILRSDLRALYDSELSGEPARLPELSVQFADFAVWQRALL